MDIIKKCELIINNTLISNQGYGSDYEVELEIYKEIKDAVTTQLECSRNMHHGRWKELGQNNIHYGKIRTRTTF